MKKKLKNPKKCKKMQNKLSYSYSNAHKTNLWQNEHSTVSFEKQCKVNRNPSPNNNNR